jgi:hypothetical protein
MDKRRFQPVVEVACNGCGLPFKLGDTIYLLRIWIISEDYCEACRNKVLAFLETLPAHKRENEKEKENEKFSYEADY